MIFSGEQMRKVTLLTKSVSYDANNQPVETWSADTSKFPSGEFYVQWWDQGGKEVLKDGQIAAIKDIRCKCRFITGLNEADYRIRKDSKDHDIESIKEIGRKQAQILILKVTDNIADA